MSNTNINQLLERLAITIQHSENGSLSVLVGDSQSYSMVARILEKLLGGHKPFVYDFARTRLRLLDFLQDVSSKHSHAVIYIWGLNEMSADKRVKTFIDLNYHRESLRETACNLVFWMNREQEHEFLQFSPDLASIRSGVTYIPTQAQFSSFQNGLIRILDKTGRPTGAGFLISPDRAITAAHLISIILGEKPEGTIEVDFPFLETQEKCLGNVIFRSDSEDIAIIKLSGNLPEYRQPVEIIDTADLHDHGFRTFGFPKNLTNGIWATGKIAGPVKVQGKNWIQVNDTQSSGYSLGLGFSGAPVWDENLQGVVGMVVASQQDNFSLRGTSGFVVPINQIVEIYKPLSETIPDYMQVVRERYLAHLLKSYRYLDFKGIPQLRSTTSELSLEEVYAPLFARPELPEGETWERRLAGRAFNGKSLPEEAIRGIERARASVPLPIEEILREKTRVVVLGDPGSGKSTMLKYLALRLANDASAQLPIILPLNAYARAVAQKDTDLQDYLADYFAGRSEGMADLGPLFRDTLSTGKAIILLDGLDEVQSNRSVLVEKVEAFAHKAVRQGNRVLVTSRIVGYRDAPLTSTDWALYTLLDFTPEIIETFVSRWCLAFEKSTLGNTPEAEKQAEAERDGLMDAIRTNPGVARLASNPLLLTILALIKRQGMELPKSRIKLYDRYLETLIEAWSRARALDKSAGRESLDYEATLEVLGPLALRIREENPTTGLISARQLQDWLMDHYTSEQWRLKPGPARAKVREFIESVRHYSNLLVERGYGQYGFIHLAFEEALAAYGLASLGIVNRQNSIDVIRKHITDPAWRETILLFIGVLGLIQKRPRVAGEVVREILKINLEGSEQGKNIILAGHCVADVGETGVGQNVAAEAQMALFHLNRDRKVSPAVQSEAGYILGRTGWLPDDLDELVFIHRGKYITGQDNAIFIIEQNFAAGKYPVTNSQFRKFIEDGGYSNASFWSDSGWDWVNQNNIIQPLYWHNPAFNSPLQPVVGVSWFEASAYCSWFSKQLKRKVYLPIENQWERIARGKQGNLYPWGNSQDANLLNSKDFWETDPVTTVVFQFPMGQSMEGIYDLCGNVWEWTATQHHKDLMVACGGSYSMPVANLNVLTRTEFNLNTRSPQIGFRVVADY